MTELTFSAQGENQVSTILAAGTSGRISFQIVTDSEKPVYVNFLCSIDGVHFTSLGSRGIRSSALINVEGLSSGMQLKLALSKDSVIPKVYGIND